MIPRKLIERALALTGKTKYYVSRLDFDDTDELGNPSTNFDWYQFAYYLFSHDFIDKYYPIFIGDDNVSEDYRFRIGEIFGDAIREYQRRDNEYPDGNELPIIILLSKI